MKCAREVCDRLGRCKHSQTGKLYCLPCARAINRLNAGGVTNLIEVPSADVIEELRRLTDYERLKAEADKEVERIKEMERIKEICLLYAVEFPEEVFDLPWKRERKP